MDRTQGDALRDEAPSTSPAGRLLRDGGLAAAYFAVLPAVGAAWTGAGLQPIGRAVRHLQSGPLSTWMLADLRSTNTVLLLALTAAALIALAHALSALVRPRVTRMVVPFWVSAAAPIVGALGVMPTWMVERWLLRIATGALSLERESARQQVYWSIVGSVSMSILVAVAASIGWLAWRRGARTVPPLGSRVSVLSHLWAVLVFAVLAHVVVDLTVSVRP